MGGLYHNASKNYHGHMNDIIIDQQWSSNEIFIIGVIYEHYKIPFGYHNEDGELEKYPYDLSGFIKAS